jgi:hypothetical protein
VVLGWHRCPRSRSPPSFLSPHHCNREDTMDATQITEDAANAAAAADELALEIAS